MGADPVTFSLMRIRVYHGYYGCETGCCGHVIEIDEGRSQFEFEHKYDDKEDIKAWATGLAQRVVRERWPECYDSIDWDSLDYTEAIDDP